MSEKMLHAAIAVTRFGLGARPGELQKVSADPRGWLARQVNDPAAFAIEGDLPDAAQALEAFRALRAQAQGAPAENDRAKESKNAARLETTLMRNREILAREIEARMARAITTESGFAERLAWFWSNHFTVAAQKGQTIAIAGAYEREAVRGNLTGSFAALHLAVMRHPGMLLYLDQAQSVGPNSPAARALRRRRRDIGLNENLAREALELHTIGAQGGYTQNDVTEFARALTGWTFASPQTDRFVKGAPHGAFVFASALHEPGPRRFMGKTYPEGGEEQARAMLADLARRPATAKRIAEKLARHFIADTPPRAAVEKLADVFTRTDGDLPSLHKAVAEMPEAWSPSLQKFKSPNEFLVSALRLVGVPRIERRALYAAFEMLGQQPLRAPSPEGWPDDAASWATPDALMKRLEWSQALGERLGAMRRPEEALAAAIGPLATDAARLAVARAQSGAQGLAIALMSPEFQRR